MSEAESPPSAATPPEPLEPSAGRLRFGAHALSLPELILYRDDEPVHLAPQPAKLLLYLLRRAGQVVPRQELYAALWGDRFVDARAGLEFGLRQVRAALGDSPTAPRFIATLPRRGYRFLGAVTWEPAPAPGAVETRPQVTATTAVAAIALAPREQSPPGGRLRLRRWAFAVVGCVVLVGGVLTGSTWLRSTSAVPPGVAVGSFTSLDSAAEPAARALAAELLVELATQAGGELTVVALPQQQALASRPGGSGSDTSDAPAVQNDTPGAFVPGPDEVVAKTAANLVVEGTVRLSGVRLVVDVRLVRTEDRVATWVERYERHYLADGGPESVQCELARRIAAGVKLALRAVPSSAVPLPVKAQAALLRGRTTLRNGGPDTLEEAIVAFDLALELVPDLAAAHSGKALALARLTRWQRRPEATGYIQAAAAARRSLEHDPASAEAYAVLALVALLGERDLATAARNAQRAVDADGCLAIAHEVSALVAASDGRPAASVAAARRAVACDPGSFSARTQLGESLLLAGDVTAAAQACREVVELEPKMVPARNCLARASQL